jgi:hypothetical protein
LAASPRQQKIILKQKLMNLKPFQKLVNLIKQSKTGYITKQELLEHNYSCSSCSGGDDADDNIYSYDFANIVVLLLLFTTDDDVPVTLSFNSLGVYGKYVILVLFI